jgi:hypothetical protein
VSLNFLKSLSLSLSSDWEKRRSEETTPLENWRIWFVSLFLLRNRDRNQMKKKVDKKSNNVMLPLFLSDLAKNRDVSPIILLSWSRLVFVCITQIPFLDFLLLLFFLPCIKQCNSLYLFLSGKSSFYQQIMRVIRFIVFFLLNDRTRETLLYESNLWFKTKPWGLQSQETFVLDFLEEHFSLRFPGRPMSSSLPEDSHAKVSWGRFLSW